ncbi:MAG TPA: hypothetical protein VMJ65_30255 [Solirubrobacteraceae bacterium]|nr:hypothetical protein [Solirubrobacteraceae bacterium]
MADSGTQNGQIPLTLIHGARPSALSWENYADCFATRGFAVDSRLVGVLDERVLTPAPTA